jgi:steroid delta-isomerase-like uncharacterized protein
LVHDIDSVERRLGREAYLAFLADRARAYREHAFDIQIMVNADGSRASAEYTLLGFPLSDAATGQEPDTSQTYRISSGLFFQIDGGRIQRISQHSPSPQLG